MDNQYVVPTLLGWIDAVDPQLARALFWLFVSYLSWYTMLPAQAGGKLLSDSMARIAMLMLAIFGVPVGVHHLYADPGVSEVVKFVHAFLMFFVKENRKMNQQQHELATPNPTNLYCIGSVWHIQRKTSARGKNIEACPSYM